ncbi:MAG: ATP-binding protein [Parasphingorhabdus sp.]
MPRVSLDAVNLNQIMNPRPIIAILLVFIGAIFANQFAGTIGPVIIMTAFGLLALAMNAIKNPESPRSQSLMLQRREADLLQDARMNAYQELIEPLHDPVLLVKSARVLVANPAALELLGDHIINEDVRVAIRHPSAAERLANPKTQHSGDPILLVGVGSPNQRWELRITQMAEGLKLVILSDQNSRYAADKMRTDFVANASHELRTPLAAIKGFIETLEDPEAGADADTRARFLKIMYDEADRMQRLVSDLMSLSRIEAERYQLPDNAVNLGALIQESTNFFVSSRNKTKADFKLNLPASIPTVKGDRAQLAQLLHNLISNAFKYGAQKEPIEIKLTPNRSGSMVRLSVIDQGEGVDPGHLPRLTERFYRVDKGRSKAIGGTGLGLSIVKHIAERHGGRLEIASELGVGTNVSVSLPVIEKPQ